MNTKLNNQMDQCYGLDMKSSLRAHILGAELSTDEPLGGDWIVPALTSMDSSILRVLAHWYYQEVM